jgi:hypothetical protein
MTTKNLEMTAVVPEEKLQVLEPQRGACVEFVKFCKEQHLNSRAAHTFLRVLHNKTWEAECEKIRESMRPEVDSMFEPAEKALSEGRNCREVLDILVHTLKETENM